MKLHDDQVASANHQGRPAKPVIQRQLDRILASKRFGRSPRLSSFLRFVVGEVLDERAGSIKARTVAIRVLDRDPSAQPEKDPLVRIHARRLRRALELYYENEGAEDPVRIEIPKGTYVPVFSHCVEVSNAGIVCSKSSSMPRGSRLPRVAVLPLINKSDSPEHDYFADGLGTELSRQFARFQELAVIAYWTTSRMPSAATDALKAGVELDADFVVAGSVTRIENLLRVRIQCIHIETGEEIWSERYDSRMTAQDLFHIEDAIVQQVVASVADRFGSISQTVFRASHDKEVEDLSAYEAVLRGLHYEQRLDKPTRDCAMSALEAAVVTAPSYATAWAMLSTLSCDEYAFNPSAASDPLAKSKKSANCAIALDRQCQHAHYASAYVGVLTHDHPRVLAACERIERLNPQAVSIVGAAAVFLGVVGEFDYAVPLLERCCDLNPYYPGWFLFLYWLRDFTAGDYERALDAAHRFNMPTFLWDPLARAACLGKLGRGAQASKAFDELLSICPDFTSHFEHYIGCFIHATDTRDDLLDGLGAAGLA